MRQASIVIALCAGALISLSAGTCWAQASDRAIAEALFQDGRQLMDAGKVAEACLKFEQSQRTDPQVGTLLNVAVCHEELGRTASAWAEFLDAEAQANRLGHADRAAFARQGVERLQGKLSRLTLNSPNPEPNLTISFDGKPFATSMLGASLPVDPGEHRVEASAPGKKSITLVIIITPGPSAQTFDLPVLEAEAPAPAALPPPPAAEPTPPPRQTSFPDHEPPPPRAEAKSTGVPGWAWASLGVGIAGLATGTVTGAMALSKATELKAECPNNVCPRDQSSNLDTALTLADISTVSFIIGAVGSTVGLTGVLLSTGSDEHAGTVLRVDFGRVDVISHF